MQLSYLDQQLDQKRQINVKTCADVYNYWRAYKRLYKKAPKDGVEFQVEYIDTGSALSDELRPTAPIALALHGAPGSYHDFALLIQHLTKQNVRVIAPNFPEYAATVKTKVLFRHSADEKAAYLRDFLKGIQVNKIDLLISHSSAMFPTLLILLNSNQEAIARRQQQQKQKQKQQADDNQKHKDCRDHAISNNDNNNNDHNCKECSRQPTAADTTTQESSLQTTKTQQQTVANNRSAAKQQRKQLRAGRGRRRTKVSSKNSDGGNKENCADDVDDADDDDDVIVKFDEPIEIKAVALFNPAGHRLPKSMKPEWFKCGSVRIYQHKLGRSLFGKLGPAFLTVVGVPVRVDNMDNVMLSATVMRNSRCHRVEEQLKRLAQMRLPTLLVFSENDKLIEKEIFYEMTQFMRLERKNFSVYEGENETQLARVQEPAAKDEDWVKVMVFKDGGHYTYSNYSKIVNEAVGDLLGRVTGVNANNNNNNIRS